MHSGCHWWAVISGLVVSCRRAPACSASACTCPWICSQYSCPAMGNSQHACACAHLFWCSGTATSLGCPSCAAMLCGPRPCSTADCSPCQRSVQLQKRTTTWFRWCSCSRVHTFVASDVSDFLFTSVLASLIYNGAQETFCVPACVRARSDLCVVADLRTRSLLEGSC